MHTDDFRSSGPGADELTPLEVSQGALEGEENPNPMRTITPRERAASGMGYGDERRASRIGRILLNPVVLGSAVVTGLGLMVALACARRAFHFHPRP